jgi:hypothetical protein
MSGNGSSTTDKISYNTRAVILGLFALVSFVLIVFFMAVLYSEAEQVGRLTPVFIAAISGTLALGGTLVSQLWSNKLVSSKNEFKGPSITKTIPFDSEPNVPVTTPIIATFNQLMEKDTINPTTFTVKNASDNSKIEGSVELIGGDVKFTPIIPLKKNTKITVMVSKDVKDTSGNTLGTDKKWSFTTTNK